MKLGIPGDFGHGEEIILALVRKMEALAVFHGKGYFKKNWYL